MDGITQETITFEQAKDYAIRVASSLTKMGLRKGDILLLISPNCPEYPILILACSVMGIVVSTANPAYTQG